MGTGSDAVNLLITIAIPLTAVRALPCDAIAGHPPKIFMHAFLAYLKAAATRPAEWRRTSAASAVIFFGMSFFFSF